mgnify:FL=1
MKGLVIYDSVFGNTQKVAEEIATVLGYSLVSVKSINEQQLKGIEHLVVGSPTRAFKPTEDMQKFLKALPAGMLKGVKVSVFDTRMDIKEVNNQFLTFMTGIFGYAAGSMTKSLTKKGAVLIGTQGDFIVTESEGPLKDGELERASAWAKGLGFHSPEK